jgi:hypothetical protein
LIKPDDHDSQVMGEVRTFHAVDTPDEFLADITHLAETGRKPSHAG